MKKRTVIYARVSTDEQAEKGTSLETQIDACQKYAARNEFIVVDTLRDEISGATRIIDRPQGKTIFALIERKAIDAIVVFTHDRLVRSLTEYVLFKDEIARHGIELHFTDSGLDENTNIGNLVGNVKAYGAAEEREKIRERSIRGRNAKAMGGNDKKSSGGRLVMSGHPPYGYRRKDENAKGELAELVIYEPEAYYVQRIFEWYVSGDGIAGPLPLRALAIKLQEIGAPTPKQRSNQSPIWIPTTIRNILKNEIYAGVSYYGKTRIINKKRVQQDKADWIKIEVPELAIIDRPIFDHAQQRAERNRETNNLRNKKFPYLLSGFFRCGACGNAMAGTSANTKSGLRLSYRCGMHWRKSEQEPCPNENRSIATHLVDTPIWDWLESLLSDEQALLDGLDEMEAKSEQIVAPKVARLESARKQIVHYQARARRFADLLGDTDDNDDIAEFTANRRDALDKMKEFEKEAADLETEIMNQTVSPEQRQNLINLAVEIRQTLQDPSFTTKRIVFDMLNLRVEYYTEGEKRWLLANIGFGEAVIPLNPSFGINHNNGNGFIFIHKIIHLPDAL